MYIFLCQEVNWTNLKLVPVVNFIQNVKNAHEYTVQVSN